MKMSFSGFHYIDSIFENVKKLLDGSRSFFGPCIFHFKMSEEFVSPCVPFFVPIPKNDSGCGVYLKGEKALASANLTKGFLRILKINMFPKIRTLTFF